MSPKGPPDHAALPPSGQPVELTVTADAAPVLLAYVDASQRYRFVNARHREWFGPGCSEERRGRRARRPRAGGRSGGFIHVESQVGVGSTFSVHLPRAEGRPAGVAAPPPAAARKGRGGRVLLVEDELAARRALEELLRDEGHTVLSAGNGIDAEKIWRETRDPIDVVITDTELMAEGESTAAPRSRSPRGRSRRR